MITFLDDTKINFLIPNKIKHYEFLKEIGTGSSSIVYQVLDKIKNKFFACKIVSRESIIFKDKMKHFEKELRIHQLIDHPNICKIEEIIYSNDFIYIILEFCSNGDLFEWISKTSHSLNCRIITQIISAIQYLHQRGIYHHDLKPENIFLDSNYNIKIGDFGNCDTIDNNSPQSFFGTIEYTPPEIFLNNKISKDLIDIYQIGLLIYEIFTGILPWKENKENLIVEIKSGINYIPDFIPLLYREVIESCININPLKRPSINNLISIITKNNEKNKKFINTAKKLCWGSLINFPKNQIESNSITKFNSNIIENLCFLIFFFFFFFFF